MGDISLSILGEAQFQSPSSVFLFSEAATFQKETVSYLEAKRIDHIERGISHLNNEHQVDFCSFFLIVIWDMGLMFEV